MFPVSQLQCEEVSAVAGIARKFPGDKGISKDSRVVFVESFEQSSIEALGKRWETVRNPNVMSVSNDVPPASSGKQSLLMTQLAELGTGGDLYRRLGEGYDQLFTRMYVKFGRNCEPIHHFGTCVGGNNPSTPWPSVRAGQPTKGDKAFWVGVEPFGKCGSGTTTPIGVKCEGVLREAKPGGIRSCTMSSSRFAEANGRALN